MTSIRSADQPPLNPPVMQAGGDVGEESLIILQSLLCLLREKNMLTRADMEALCHKVERRASGTSRMPLPCCSESAANASGIMQRLTSYIGQRYGGKHARN
ncbi:hypothetical protein [Sphingomonas bacterium]|uniref:hypothetical protein n=1 Tax=Sphingomonas bacterium TaxID=1895847 RepID=UPI0020C62718|nr:hypothetical protein [Sphingomonas bacterium]